MRVVWACEGERRVGMRPGVLERRRVGGHLAWAYYRKKTRAEQTNKQGKPHWVLWCLISPPHLPLLPLFSTFFFSPISPLPSIFLTFFTYLFRPFFFLFHFYSFPPCFSSPFIFFSLSRCLLCFSHFLLFSIFFTFSQLSPTFSFLLSCPVPPPRLFIILLSLLAPSFSLPFFLFLYFYSLFYFNFRLSSRVSSSLSLHKSSIFLLFYLFLYQYRHLQISRYLLFFRLLLFSFFPDHLLIIFPLFHTFFLVYRFLAALSFSLPISTFANFSLVIIFFIFFFFSFFPWPSSSQIIFFLFFVFLCLSFLPFRISRPYLHLIPLPPSFSRFTYLVFFFSPLSSLFPPCLFLLLLLLLRRHLRLFHLKVKKAKQFKTLNKMDSQL